MSKCNSLGSSKADYNKLNGKACKIINFTSNTTFVEPDFGDGFPNRFKLGTFKKEHFFKSRHGIGVQSIIIRWNNQIPLDDLSCYYIGIPIRYQELNHAWYKEIFTENAKTNGYWKPIKPRLQMALCQCYWDYLVRCKHHCWQRAVRENPT